MEAIITKIEQLSDDVKLFRLSLSKPLTFLAGQFVMLSVKDKDGKMFKRAYSLASSPSQHSMIELCIRILPNGKVTQILNTLKKGDHVEIDGPYGKSSLDISKKKEIILVAIGCGVGAVRSILYSLFEQEYESPIWFFFGFRYDKDFLFKHEFAQFEEKYPQFHFVPVMSKPSQHSDPDIDVGHVTDIIPRYIKDGKNKEAFICGSMALAKDVIAVLEETGISKEHIKTDSWG